ncbi:MAG: DUF3791 domain-containing protein [Victivallales bacterium]|nr:DUF3791 domain-containing protein [Victivallales bacterium]
MSKEGDFFIYLLEGYAAHKGTTADKVLAQWDALDLTEFIYGLYELYHVECLENAFDDIDRLTAERLAIGVANGNGEDAGGTFQTSPSPHG